MNNNKVIQFIFIISSAYLVIYIFSIAISSIIQGEFPNIEHTEAQAYGILFVFAFGMVFGISILTYLFPDFRHKIHGRVLPAEASPFEILLHISTEDEIKILLATKELLPKAYKFEVAKKSGLSRMKTHRIILRLEERNILRVERDGRYSKIYFTDWLSIST
ncbi:MAG: hypothetical protein OEZ01_08195 [Candidatus Heimdallarchaeota archaeon]|nr:hypothetical protein [Candidatus Heimdallarchaeota archaeon]MDH5645973.1 hypothetical protein [Candidatus Heimdallarchaeota archaeon]